MLPGSTRPATRPHAMPSFDESPFILFWETTRACDLACKHCRACAVPSRDPRELTTAEGRALLREAAALGTKLVVLTGGDPAKRPDLVELVEYGAGLGIRMALTPSATPLVTRDWLAELRKVGLARLAISVDGSKAATHDRFRGVVGSWERSHAILCDARELGLTTQVNTSVCPENLEELPLLATQLAALDIELWSVFFVVPTGRATGMTPLSAEAVESVLEWLEVLVRRSPFDVKTTAAPQFRRVLLQKKHERDDIVGLRSLQRSPRLSSTSVKPAESPSESTELPAGLTDGIGRSPRGVNDGQGVVFVSHVGEIQPSGFLPIVAGNVRMEGLSRTYRESPLFKALRDTDQLGGKCGRCEFRKVCGGSRARAHAVTGDVLAEDPSCTYQPRRKAS